MGLLECYMIICCCVVVDNKLEFWTSSGILKAKFDLAGSSSINCLDFNFGMLCKEIKGDKIEKPYFEKNDRIWVKFTSKAS